MKVLYSSNKNERLQESNRNKMKGVHKQTGAGGGTVTVTVLDR